MRILVVQETDWMDRYPILHHRILEALSIGGDEITVLDYELLWGRRGSRPLWQGRRVWTNVSKIHADSRVKVVRPAMLRVPGLARPSWLLMTWFELWRYFRAGKPDAVVAYGISNSFLARIFARRHRVPFVFHLFDSLHALAEPAVLRPVASAVEALVLRSADRVVIPYKAMARYLSRMGVNPSRVVLIPNGMSRRDADPAVRAAMRRQLGIADHQVALLFFGWLYRHSGLADVALELARDRAKYARLKLVVVGDGDLARKLQEIKSANGLDGQLILAGRRPYGEITEYIAASDVCLMVSEPNPAMRYVVPMKVYEYLEFGKPIFSTPLDGMREEFSDGGGIVWVNQPRDVLPRLAGILAAADDEDRVLTDYTRAAVEYAARREDWETVTQRFRSLLAATTPRSVD